MVEMVCNVIFIPCRDGHTLNVPPGAISCRFKSYIIQFIH
jgi:hypothetical protein